MPPVGFQLGFAGAPGTDAAALPGQAGAHTGKPGQQILVLGKLHLEPTFLGLCPLGENIQNQGAAVDDRHADDLLQCPDISGGQLVVKNHHGGLGSLSQHPDLLSLALADEAVGIRSMPVLEHFAGAEASGGFQQILQFLQGFLRGGLFLGKAVRVQSHQHRPLLDGGFKFFFHRFLRSIIHYRLV